MREPTREEWSDWASAGRAKEPRPAVVGLFGALQQMLGMRQTPQQQAALQMQYFAAMQNAGMNTQIYGHCPTCGHRPSLIGSLLGF